MRYHERQNSDDQRLRLGELIERLNELAAKYGSDPLVDLYIGSESGPAFHADPIEEDGKVLGITIFGN